MQRTGKILICLLLILAGCSTFRPSWVNENSFTVVEGEELPGTFDEDGNYIPENPDVEWTYKIPDISAGFIIDINSVMDNEDRQDAKFISPSLQIELVEFDLPYLRTFKIDFGVAYQRTYLYFGKLLTSVYEISVGVFVGYDFENNQPSFGIAGAVIKF